MRSLGVRQFRMSLAWPRLLPSGTGELNQVGSAVALQVRVVLGSAGWMLRPMGAARWLGGWALFLGLTGWGLPASGRRQRSCEVHVVGLPLLSSSCARVFTLHAAAGCACACVTLKPLHCLQAGVDFYNRVIDALLANCIQPHITVGGGMVSLLTALCQLESSHSCRWHCRGCTGCADRHHRHLLPARHKLWVMQCPQHLCACTCTGWVCWLRVRSMLNSLLCHCGNSRLHRALPLPCSYTTGTCPRRWKMPTGAGWGSRLCAILRSMLR